MKKRESKRSSPTVLKTSVAIIAAFGAAAVASHTESQAVPDLTKDAAASCSIGEADEDHEFLTMNLVAAELDHLNAGDSVRVHLDEYDGSGVLQLVATSIDQYGIRKTNIPEIQFGEGDLALGADISLGRAEEILGGARDLDFSGRIVITGAIILADHVRIPITRTSRRYHYDRKSSDWVIYNEDVQDSVFSRVRKNP